MIAAAPIPTRDAIREALDDCYTPKNFDAVVDCLLSRGWAISRIYADVLAVLAGVGDELERAA